MEYELSLVCTPATEEFVAEQKRKPTVRSSLATTEYASMRDCALMVLAKEGSMACELSLHFHRLP